ncbi:MAG TPA: hypothetical protein VKT77_11670 [Chthonomonadaceae bacterium]|nr:hypothetical protein [Chthonomonadaceae bacterium]
MDGFSVTDLREFPFESFGAFREAYAGGQARVWTRYDVRAVWRYSSPAERALQAALTGSGLLACPAFAVLAWATHDAWWLCGIVAALLGLMAASPSPGLVSGGGCVACPLFAAGVIGSVFLDRSLLWCGVIGFCCWFLACAGQGVGDATLREAMVTTEEALVYLVQRGAITRIEPIEEPPAESTQ